MDLSAYDRIVIDKFMGLYNRGLDEECPQDHGLVAVNLTFSRGGEYSTRGGLLQSLILTHPVRRQFLATFNNSTLNLLTLDDSGNLYKDSNPTPILSIGGMIDFVGLNLFNHCFILPVGPADHLKIWDGTNPVRNALGLAPTGGPISPVDDGAGNVDPGIHQFAVSYITSTGFTTKPGEAVEYTAPGSKKVIIFSLPIGPAGTVGRQIIGTKSNLELFYYIPGGTVNDNTTTNVTLDFRDTDLAVSADSLFDQLETVNSAGADGYLDKYHGRLIVLGGEGDLVRVSKSGAPESFDSLTGYIQIPSEFDGNVVKGSFQLRDSLYFSKSVGLFNVTDNGNEPASWTVIPIDGSVGGVSHGIASITASQNNLDVNDNCLIADFAGLYLFNGVVQQPPLTYKIDDVWKQYIYPGVVGKATVFVDPFQKVIYICMGGMDFLLVGDYNDGMDHKNIKWSEWAFPAPVKNISVVTYKDVQGFGYYLRVSFIGVSGLYRVDPNTYSDLGSAINTRFQTYMAKFDEGSVNIFRAVRIGVQPKNNATITITPTLIKQDGTSGGAPTPFTVGGTAPIDYLREFNLTGEKCGILLSFSSTTNRYTMHRIDIFGKPFWSARPA